MQLRLLAMTIVAIFYIGSGYAGLGAKVKRMPDTARPKMNRRRYQLLIMFLICLQCLLIYLFAFKDWRGPGDFGGNYNYIPAVMLAAGKGFTDIEMNSVGDIPELDRFIRFESMQMDPSLLPEDMPIIEANDLHRIYQYLLYTVGYLWGLQCLFMESAGLCYLPYGVCWWPMPLFGTRLSKERCTLSEIFRRLFLSCQRYTF